MIAFKIKENKSRILLIFLSTILIAGWFYWFQWRPSEIRKECFKNISAKSGPENWTDSETNNYYRICLVKKGLPAESLLVNID